MKRTEQILVLFSLIGIVLCIVNLPGEAFITTTSLLALGVVYFYFGFALFNEIPISGIFKKVSYSMGVKRILIAIASGITLSIAAIAILFKVERLPGADFLSIISLFLLLIISVLLLFKKSPDNSNFVIGILRRQSLWGSMVLNFLFFLSFFIDRRQISEFSSLKKCI